MQDSTDMGVSELLEFTLKPKFGCRLPVHINIVMGGRILTEGTEFTYNRYTGRVCVHSVTGEIEVFSAPEPAA